MSNKVYFKTFGCRTNQFDTQVMINSLKDFELTENIEEAKVVVINSCTVTNGADVSIRQYIRLVEKKYPNIKVVLAGCGTLSKGEELFKNENLFGVLGHSKKEEINSLLKEENSFFELGDLNSIDNSIIEDFIGKSRAFIKIQEGCDFACSYCIIPSVRGKARSFKEETILKQIEVLTNKGFSEFILTGTNVGSYGKDRNRSISKLLKKISLINGVKRVRLGSLEPIQIEDEFIELLDEKWMTKQLHIAIQHTNNKMLEIMNRRNRFESDLKLFNKIANKNIAIGTDFIVGHPFETNEVWKDAKAKIEELPLTHIHSFTYSKRDNTLSAKMKNEVRGDIAKIRLKELNSIIKEKNLKFREKNSKNLEVLIEKGGVEGFDQYYNKLKLTNKIEEKWILIKEAKVENENNFF